MMESKDFDVTISRISEGDVAETAVVMKNAFNFVDQGWGDEDSLKNVKMISGYDFSIKAVHMGVIVGFLASYLKDDHLYIDEIAVDPKYMGKGVAKKLWKEALEYAKKNKVDWIKLIADPKSVAYKWYKKLGLTESGWVELSVEMEY